MKTGNKTDYCIIKDRHMALDAQHSEYLKSIPGTVFYRQEGSVLNPYFWNYAHGEYTPESFLESIHKKAGYVGNPMFSLRSHQDEAIQAITDAHDKGAPGFVLGDSTGFGKMVVAAKMIRDSDITNALVVAPKSSLSDWKNTVDEMVGNGGKNIIVIHYEAIWDLFEYHGALPPMLNDYPRTFIEFGELIKDMSFDMVVFDESHRVSNMDTMRNTALRKIIDATGAFALYTSATSFTANSDCYYLAPLLGWKYGIPAPDTILDDEQNDYRQWFGNIAQNVGLDVDYGSHNSYIVRQTHENDLMINELFFGEPLERDSVQFRVGMARNPLDIGYPIQSRSRRAIKMNRDNLKDYHKSWRKFREDYDLSLAGHRNPDGLLDSLMRAIQKSSLIKVPYAVERIKQLIDEGYQVIAVTQYHETILALAEALSFDPYMSTNYMQPVVVYGDTPDKTKRLMIDAFNNEQINIKGSNEEFRIPVIITSVVDAINLHEGTALNIVEEPRPRYTLFVDILMGGKKSLQAEGRGQRDGYEALCEYFYLQNTVEERMLARSIDKMMQIQRKNNYAEDVAELARLQDGLDRDIPIPGFDDIDPSDRNDLLKIIEDGDWQP